MNAKAHHGDAPMTLDEALAAGHAWERWGARALTYIASLRVAAQSARAAHRDLLDRCRDAERRAEDAERAATRSHRHIERLTAAVAGCGHPRACVVDGRCQWCADLERLASARRVLAGVRAELRETQTLRRDGALVLEREQEARAGREGGDRG